MRFLVGRSREAQRISEDCDPCHRSPLAGTYRPFACVVALLLVALPSTMVAVQRNARKATISEAVWVGTTLLTPGDYEVKWDGTGSLVQVSFLQANKKIATCTATAAVTASPHDRAAIEVRAISDSSKALARISWKDVSLTFDTIHPF